jgi:hypothetical protein
VRGEDDEKEKGIIEKEMTGENMEAMRVFLPTYDRGAPMVATIA